MPNYQTNKNISGWFFDHEGHYYENVTSKIHNGNILEIGSYHGLSLSYIIETCRRNNNHIVSLDIKIRHQLLNNIKSWNAESVVTPIEMDSTLAYKLFPPNFFDLIFIDGGHSYKQVKNDIYFWHSRLKNNCLLIGHDYDWPGVKQAVNELLPESLLKGRIWSIVKTRELYYKLHL